MRNSTPATVVTQTLYTCPDTGGQVSKSQAAEPQSHPASILASLITPSCSKKGFRGTKKPYPERLPKVFASRAGPRILDFGLWGN